MIDITGQVSFTGQVTIGDDQVEALFDADGKQVLDSDGKKVLVRK